nr:HTH domain-containing protein [Shuttleworthia satelles]
MLLTNRIRGILLLLMDAEGPLKEDDIADQVGVSRRTVQREVEYLDGALREYGLLLLRKKGVGISVTGSEQAKERLRGELEEKEAGEPTDVAGRRNRLLFELIRDKVPRKIYYYSQLLGVSEATVNKDMSALGPWLEQNHLKLVKRQGFGVALSGSERDLRAAMRRFVN